MIKLSQRLDKISSLVPINSKIIDVGCDHALLDIYLCQKRICSKIIASDINPNALNNAKENIKKASLDKDIECRLGNGIDTLKENDDIDTIIISGMGTHTIIGILKNNIHKLKNIHTLIIQSNTKLELLRKEITKLDYIIDDEIILEDNKKIYTIIKFIKGRKKYSRKELYFGPILLKEKNHIFIKYNNQELEKLNIYLKLIPRNRLIERYKLKKTIKMYLNVL